MLYWLTLAAQRLTSIMPRGMRWWLGSVVTEVVYWVWTEKRIATQKNMSVVLNLPRSHPQVKRIARLSWRNYGRLVADYFDLSNHTTAEHLAEFNDPIYSLELALDGVAEAKSGGHGVVLITAHYGNFDKAGILVASRYPLIILAERLANPKLDDLFQEQRRHFGLTLIMVDDAIRPLMRALKSGAIIGTPIDSPLQPNEGIPVQFFGRTAYAPRGIGALAVKYRAAIMPSFSWYNDKGGYSAKVFPPTTIEKTGDENADTIRATQVMFDALESIIRQDPTQWYMFRQFWPDDESEHVKRDGYISLAKAEVPTLAQTAEHS